MVCDSAVGQAAGWALFLPEREKGGEEVRHWVDGEKLKKLQMYLRAA